MYIMCVCLFSALSRRVGALQISIIIINMVLNVSGFCGLNVYLLLNVHRNYQAY